jgi:hypothetical protein
LLAFSATRNYHRLVVAIEDAGFEIRDMISWVYSSGFPKSLDVSKAIQGKLDGHPRYSANKMEVAGESGGTDKAGYLSKWSGKSVAVTAPEALQWSGWGTGLKPSMEVICCARKPLDGTVAETMMKYGCGAMNIDAGRTPEGRWPANFIHDGSDEVVSMFPNSKSSKSNPAAATSGFDGAWAPSSESVPGYGDEGSAARFFYSAKATTRDKNEGLEDHEYITVEQCNETAILRVDAGMSPPKVIAVSGASNKTACEWNTFLFGKQPTGLSHLATTCTTSMRTSSITTSPTLNFLASLITNAATAGCEERDGVVHKPCRKCGTFYPVDHYYVRPDGIHSWCRPCSVANATENKRKRRALKSSLC